MSELIKDQIVNLKRGELENKIAGPCASAFTWLMGRGIYLWHDTIKGVHDYVKNKEKLEKISKFYDEAWNLENDKSVTNRKLKTATIIKLWIEGLSLCFKEMSNDYYALRKLIGIDSTYRAIDNISINAEDALTDIMDTAYDWIDDKNFLGYIDARRQELRDLINSDLGLNEYKLRLVKMIIEVICSSFIYIEDKEFENE